MNTYTQKIDFFDKETLNDYISFINCVKTQRNNLFYVVEGSAVVIACYNWLTMDQAFPEWIISGLNCEVTNCLNSGDYHELRKIGVMFE